jgi:KDO2-lipid IV(A) lauroyltransferase
VLTHKSLSLLAIKTQSLVLPIYNLRKPDGTYLIKFLKPLEMPKEGPLEKRIIETTTLFNNLLEKMILEDPSQWYWIHRRFKDSLPL